GHYLLQRLPLIIGGSGQSSQMVEVEKTDLMGVAKIADAIPYHAPIAGPEVVVEEQRIFRLKLVHGVGKLFVRPLPRDVERDADHLPGDTPDCFVRALLKGKHTDLLAQLCDVERDLLCDEGGLADPGASTEGYTLPEVPPIGGLH